MPGYDGTGPIGTGPIGQGLGPCGRGLGKRGFRGRGFGRGFGQRAWTGYSEPVELNREEKIKVLKAEKEDIEKALRELEKQ